MIIRVLIEQPITAAHHLIRVILGQRSEVFVNVQNFPVITSNLLYLSRCFLKKANTSLACAL